MKRIISAILIIMTILASFAVVSVSAADFEVKDGVLLSYNGTATSVTIPSTVYCIADSAFEGNTKITSVNLSNVTIIGNKAFYGCASLKTITGGASVKSCGAYAFEGTSYLYNNTETTVILGSVLLKSKASGAFTVGSAVTSIAPYSFADNTTITSVKIPANVAEIGEGAFFNATALATVSVSDTVGYIGAYAFQGTPWLSSQKDTFVVVGAGILINVNSTAQSLTIPTTVRHIAAGVFYNNTKLKSITLPSTLSGIGKRAFAGCTALASVTFPSSVVMIDDEAFTGCTALTSVEIPSTVAVLGESAFLGCTALKTAIVCAQSDIPAGLFANCTKLTSVIIGSKAERIGKYAFYKCTALKEISVPDTVKNFDAAEYTSLKNLTVYCNDNSYVYSQCTAKGVSCSQIGDANNDGSVNVRDATQIQKATASMITLTFTETLKGDADFNSKINIKDATAIQKYSADIRN